MTCISLLYHRIVGFLFSFCIAMGFYGASRLLPLSHGELHVILEVGKPMCLGYTTQYHLTNENNLGVPHVWSDPDSNLQQWGILWSKVNMSSVWMKLTRYDSKSEIILMGTKIHATIPKKFHLSTCTWRIASWYRAAVWNFLSATKSSSAGGQWN